MATLTAWKFSTTHGADSAEYTMRELERQGYVTVHDAAVVAWEPGAKRPVTRRAGHPGGHDALTGSFWGLLFGVLFFMPFLGAAVGAAVGGLRGSLRDMGIDDAFMEEVRRQVVPGTSALFLLTSDAVVSEVSKAFAGQEHRLISTNLSAQDERLLREVLSDDDPGVGRPSMESSGRTAP